MSPHRIVVLGYGMAGARLADEIRRRDPAGERVALTVVGDEPEPAYNRVLLSAVVAGTMRPEAVRLHEPDWAHRNRVDLRLGVGALRIDRERRTVELTDGSTVDYDTLVLATGARPWLPPVEDLCDEAGDPAPGVVPFRTLEDCARILDAARVGAPVAVLGGGLLGLEAARGLAGRGNLVTVVHPVGHLMERQLDPGAGRVLARTLGGLGIDLRLGVTAARYLAGPTTTSEHRPSPGEGGAELGGVGPGSAGGLKLDDGSHVQADLVVVAAGVRADTALAEAAGLAVDRGVLVDDALRTSDGRIFALGDCARHPGTVSGLVQPAWEQAEVLADLLTGTDTAARYRGTPVLTRLKARDIDLAAFGETHTEVADETAEVLCLTDPTRGRYAKLVLREGRVTGAILLGAPDAAATVTQFYDRGTVVPEDRLGLLLGRALPTGTPVAASPVDLPASAVVCRCNSVNKGRLVDAWRAGATSVPELAAATRATTGCGSCADAVCGIADWLATTA
ncbi:assimilatory nitrate reductase electron transfer subunit [Amycolatopsis arida]|uniref:Assimilatory nitrate reductase electron transfer subunit n=1 Tax=Amycolatopsis arida TaxID=587909 RepID=A0A1I5WDI8_9PSEU|nr:FAD-dependent oxidoreductase [Amycolatopsis arida]TDX92230.1 assimilatory nitrate reductase electron transfer subunit [Amycolatopsis arida]SFQ17813.1 assimilatory nitrate reductase electron transfer subunit [Amycolatopsis arida]